MWQGQELIVPTTPVCLQKIQISWYDLSCCCRGATFKSYLGEYVSLKFEKYHLTRCPLIGQVIERKVPSCMLNEGGSFLLSSEKYSLFDRNTKSILIL